MSSVSQYLLILYSSIYLLFCDSFAFLFEL
nr:MAG TPA: hypothetical protein [Caudoviricetes sp.]